MADHVDSDACDRSKRRFTNVEETLLQQQEGGLPGHSSQKGPKESSFTLSSLGEELGLSENREKVSLSESFTVFGSGRCGRITQDFAIKVENFDLQMQQKENCVVIGEQEQGDFEGSIFNIEEQNEKEKDCVKSEVGSSGVAEFDNQGVSGIHENRESLTAKEKDGSSLETKKQLVAEVEVGSFFKSPAQSSRGRVTTGVDTDKEISSTLKGVDESVRCSLKIQVIDDTAVIEPVSVPNTGNGNVKVTENNGTNNKKQGTSRKKAKQPIKKGKDMKAVQATSGWPKKMTQIDEDPNGGKKRGDQMKRKYSKEQLEDLRFVKIVEQRKLWRDIYTHLGDAVAKDYDDLASSKHQKNYNDPRQCFGRKANSSGILGVKIR